MVFINFTQKLTLILLIILSTLSLAACHSSSTAKKIGIIIPIEHQSLTEIVAGFKDTLLQTSAFQIDFKIANAQGDMNLQRAIIQQMNDQHYDLIVPVGLTTTQAAIALVRDKPILSLAATLTEEDRKKQKPCRTAIVDDAISPKRIMGFIHEVYPTLTHLTLIHSASEKIYPDVETATAAAIALGITIKPMLVTQLNELYNIAHAIPEQTEAILVLKDNLIVSGIGTLEALAAKRHIPLISSDEGSVENGAAFALGVPEREVGVAGAALANSILSGKPICDLPIVDMKQLTVFINQSALTKENLSVSPVQKAAKKMSYAIKLIGSLEKKTPCQHC